MPSREPAGLRYVAVGDSYTIGTGVDPAERWPAQLAATLAPATGAALQLVANLAVNGRTSGELVREQLPALARLEPGFVSCLIGVNDVVRGIPADRYEANVVTILAALLARLPRERILTVGIPDYTVTPRGADYGDPGRQRGELVLCNAIMASRSAEHGIRHVEVFDLSQAAAAEPGLVAADGLHPSGAQYARWVARIAPVVADLLAAKLQPVSDRRA